MQPCGLSITTVWAQYRNLVHGGIHSRAVAADLGLFSSAQGVTLSGTLPSWHVVAAFSNVHAVHGIHVVFMRC